MNKSLVRAVVIGAILILPACGKSPNDRVTKRPPAPAPSNATEYLPSQVPTNAVTPGDYAEAQTTAVSFLTAFSHVNLSQAEWETGIAPFLTPSASEDYQLTDIANVPIHSVDPSSAVTLPVSTSYVAQVRVATDVGLSTVTLVHIGTQWKVQKATMPR